MEQIDKKSAQLPLPFPVFTEQFLPAPQSAFLKFVYFSYPTNQSVILFTQGLDPSEVQFCVQSDFKSKVLGTKDSTFSNKKSVLIVHCEWNRSWQDGKTVSVGSDNDHIFPSTAYLHTQLMSSVRGPKYRICAMTQVRDASKFVPDWVRYHRRIGIDHFYIFDNNSSEPYLQDPDVEYISFPWKKSQFQALTYGVHVVRSRCQWLAVFDVDEFIYPRGAGSVPEMLAGLDRGDVGEITLRMLTMSSTDLVHCPNASVPEGYIYRRKNATADAKAPKSISWVEGLDGHHVHNGIFRKGYKKSRRVEVASEAGYIIHYNLQCWSDYYVSKYKYGRNGLVSDWVDAGYRQHVVPKGWERRGREYSVRDTSFRDYFLEVIGRPCPEPALVY